MNRVDLDDAVAFAHTSRLSRSVRKNLADDDLILLRLDLHADAAVMATGVRRECLEFLRCEQLTVWIVELLHQASGRLLVELTGVERIDVALIDELQDLIEQGLTAAHDTRL